MPVPVEVYGLLAIITATLVVSTSLIVWARQKDRQVKQLKKV